MNALLVAWLGLAAPVLDSFDAELDPQRWYVGVAQPPRKGRLRLQKSGWIVSRSIPDETIERLELSFAHKGGTLVVTFHDSNEPLSSPIGPPIRIKRGKGDRLLVVTRERAEVDGERLDWSGSLRGTFRIEADRGDLELDEVRVQPRLPAPPEPTGLEKRSVHFTTTPLRYRTGEELFERCSLILWDAEVAFLFRRDARGRMEPLRSSVRGAPILGALVRAGDGKELAFKAGGHSLAMGDWGDERRNLDSKAFARYLAEEYAVFEVIQLAQRALNARFPHRKELEALVHLAVIRHAENTHAAVALAETQKAKSALALLRKALGKDVDIARSRPDAIRKAAGRAALDLLGEPPPEWPGFRPDPQSRFVTMQQARDLVR